jgi:hypothetical protein
MWRDQVELLAKTVSLNKVYETAEKSNRFFFCRHLYKMLAGRLPWESEDSDDEVLLLYAVGNKRERKWVHVFNMK